MTEHEEPELPLTGLENDARARSLPDDVRALVDYARAFAKAEGAFQKARAAYAARETLRAAVFLAVGIVLICLAVFALVFGVLIALAQHIGAWSATAIVTGSLFLLASGFALIARAFWRRALNVMKPGSAPKPEPAGEGEA